MSTKITTKTGKPLTSAQHIFDSLESAIHSWKKSWIVKNGWDHVMSLPSFWAVAWFRQAETVQVLREDLATFPTIDVFLIFFRFKKENLAWWWFQSIFHRNVIQRNLLGHSFCCFFMGMLDVFKCQTKTWSIVFLLFWK